MFTLPLASKKIPSRQPCLTPYLLFSTEHNWITGTFDKREAGFLAALETVLNPAMMQRREKKAGKLSR